MFSWTNKTQKFTRDIIRILLFSSTHGSMARFVLPVIHDNKNGGDLHTYQNNLRILPINRFLKETD